MTASGRPLRLAAVVAAAAEAAEAVVVRHHLRRLRRGTHAVAWLPRSLSSKKK